MTRIIRLEKTNMQAVIKEAKEALQKGGVIVYPTDTVYGLGGDATDPAIVEKIRKTKGIEEKKPFSVMMADLAMIEEYCVVDFSEELVLKKYLPGPYTFILKLHRPLAASTGLTLGVRIPEQNFCIQLCETFKKPIITTSANKTGERPPRSFSDIDKEILEAADLAIDGGQTKYEQPSVIIDLVEKKVIRAGATMPAGIKDLFDL